MKDAQLIIIGGGAAGMTAAICAARTGIRVILLEHNDRVGKKILSTGNGRCNLSNVSVSASDYGGNDPAFAMRVMDRYGPQETLSFLREIGVPTTEEEGRIYPRTMQAQTVTDALRFAMRRAGVDIKTNTDVVSVVHGKNDFLLKTASGESLHARTLLFATGGKAAPKTGSDGSAFCLVESLGHELIPVRPALMPLITDAPYRRALSGLRIHARVSLSAGDDLICTQTGQVQFTDYGLSGIPVFQLSDRAGDLLNAKRRPRVHLDFLPDEPLYDVYDELNERMRTFSDDDLVTMLNGFLPKKLLIELCKLCGMRPSDTMKNIDPDTGYRKRKDTPLCGQMKDLAHLCKDLPQTVTGTKGFEAAQTTAGGVKTDTLTTDLQSRMVKGLFFAGEIVDIHGKCGGYNLQWAFSSGMAAGTAAAREAKAKR